MRPLARGLPGAGFLIIIVSYLTAAAFLYFGAQTPKLESAFEILNKPAQKSFSGFTESDVTVLRGVLDEHREFAQALLGRGSAKFLETPSEGWLKMSKAHLVVRPTQDKPTQLHVESFGNPRDYPISVVVSGNGGMKTLKLTSTAAVVLEWGPNELKTPNIFSFTVTPAGHGRPSSTWGVRISAAKRESQ